MKTKKFNKIEAIKCDKCGNMFISGETNGLPNGLGFQLQDGKLINLCQACIIEQGKLKEAGDEVGLKSFWSGMGVEI